MKVKEFIYNAFFKEDFCSLDILVFLSIIYPVLLKHVSLGYRILLCLVFIIFIYVRKKVTKELYHKLKLEKWIKGD